MKTTLKIRVKSEDIDDMEHVNNSVYFSYLEDARAHWFLKEAISFEEMKKRNIGIVLLRIDILYVRESTLGDTLEIYTQPKRLGNKSFIFEQIIFNSSGYTVTEATITNVMFDRESRKSIGVIDEIICAFQNTNN